MDGFSIEKDSNVTLCQLFYCIENKSNIFHDWIHPNPTKIVKGTLKTKKV